MSRTTSTVLVAALHVLFVLFFVISVRPFDMKDRPIIETILTLPLPGNQRPREEPLNPQPLTNAPPRENTAPIAIPKPIIIIKPEEQNPSSAAPTPGDVLTALGRQLACSAGSWEHLTTAERTRCGIYPWRAAKLPNGSVVMIPRSMLPRLREPDANEDFRVSGSEQIQRNLNGNPPCPILQNTPCLHPADGGASINILGGNN
ncbi:MAG TPA: hypothetical protein VGC16_07405 [Rhizomicrobium sp.]